MTKESPPCPPLQIRLLGLATIGEALLFNLAFARLAARFDYPDILRHPAEEVLARFAAGGPGLILDWYGLAASALLMVPVALGLALRGPALGPRQVAAAILGSLAGLVQAIGLLRWVFAVPALAALPQADAATFAVLNQWGGVAIGEHIGALATAGFLIAMAPLVTGRIAAALARSSAALMVLGAGEGLLLALGRDGAAFGLAAMLGFLGFSGWLVLVGAALVRRPGA